MDILFLDANVLFSAAYREQASISKFWILKNVQLTTSHYAFEEAQRNLFTSVQKARLMDLIQRVDVYPSYDESLIPHGIKLKDKDRPILAAAIGVQAHYLITGDVSDFGCFYGRRIAKVMIVPPSDYLKKYYKRKQRYLCIEAEV